MSTTAPTTTTPLKPALRTARRTAWLALALFWSAFAVLEGVNHGWLAGLFALALFIAPDLTFLAAAGDARHVEKGQLPARAVPFYNTAHRALIPLALMVAYTLLSLTWAPLFAGLCGWLAHISYDRAFGYGLRTKEGFQRA
ncbi:MULTISPECIES: DUF4260 family protein [unclassified Streptomyces]|uniref:DUF4260 family protein n=1 Tax=unclassified Streptomyces TaxID=2593676 RepID=UPI000DB9E8D0|nr:MULTISPECIES: DUF4260 family protein [unclassified Streptomyces]MYT70791.1 DUF4260 family protein [Streptomyces sp. SID8367]RAJ90496.1 uncharacterized protein DUF4260 [Streptomyces sp. PsTaAH-137]